MKKTKQVIALVLAMIGIIIAFQNKGDATISLLFKDLTLPMTIFILIMLLIGFFTGVFTTMIFSRWRKAK